MSIINLAATCLAPNYPNLYIVRTSIMTEAEANGGLDSITKPKTTSETATGTWLGLLLGFVPLIIVGALTGFSAGDESSPLPAPRSSADSSWRGFAARIFGWALVGTDLRDPWAWLYTLIALSPVAAPAIGEFVVVGRMLSEYGVCTYLR
ncbi:hypothetical protein BJX65DRAFT_291515 [Aspergillus insuetus]